MTATQAFHRLAFFAVGLALIVVVLGAYTRLTDGGLGCPDWPGCYGQVVVPQTPHAIAKAAELYPTIPVQPSKAWAEMIHRYVAGTLGLVILALAALAIRARRQGEDQPWKLPLFLIVLVAFQALLGKWTVTMLLLPLVVMSHLLGGLSIFACLAWLCLRTRDGQWRFQRISPWAGFAVFALFVLALQIALGGWTSTNYAALSCPDFPYCQGQLIPKMNIERAFNFFRPLGNTGMGHFHGGVLGNVGRLTINTFHRFGSLVAALVLGILAAGLLFSRSLQAYRRWGVILSVLLFTQMLLGVLNITELLPLPVAVSHNAVAALLLLAVVAINFHLRYQRVKEAADA